RAAHHADRGSSRVILFLFFFQAEDGIRDGHVTGVQTCALPISRDGVSGRGRTARVPPGAQGQWRAAAGKAGAADFPEREHVTRRRRIITARASRLPRASTFAAPALPAAAWPSHDPPNATRSLPFRPETRVSGRLPADQRHPAGHVHVEPLHGRQDVAVDHVVLGPEEADGELAREVVEQLGLPRGEAPVDTEGAADEADGADRPAEDVEVAGLARPEIGRTEAERDAV